MTGGFVLAAGAAIMMAVTLYRGWFPFPFGMKAYRDGPDKGLYQLSFVILGIMILMGVAMGIAGSL